MFTALPFTVIDGPVAATADARPVAPSATTTAAHNDAEARRRPFPADPGSGRRQRVAPQLSARPENLRSTRADRVPAGCIASRSDMNPLVIEGAPAPRALPVDERARMVTAVRPGLRHRPHTKPHRRQRCFGRVATDLRVSLADRGNPRCSYCGRPGAG